MKRRIFPWALIAAAAIFLLLQLFPVRRDNPPVAADLRAPAAVKAVLRRSCYDCHSNETIWPFYSRIAPASWLVAHHVHEGRENLNFSEWERMDPDDQADSLRAILRMVGKGKMPITSYLLLHPDARLSDADKKIILDWARSVKPGT